MQGMERAIRNAIVEPIKRWLKDFAAWLRRRFDLRGSRAMTGPLFGHRQMCRPGITEKWGEQSE